MTLLDNDQVCVSVSKDEKSERERGSDSEGESKVCLCVRDKLPESGRDSVSLYICPWEFWEEKK